MKLGVKIFCGIMIPFSVIVLAGGYFLLSFFFETTMNREIQAAWEQYQYNKFLVQSAMVTGEEVFAEDDVENGIENRIEAFRNSSIAEDLNGTSALFFRNQSQIYNEFDKQVDLQSLLAEAETAQVHYEFQNIGNRLYLLMAGMIEGKEDCVCLVTGIEVEYVLKLQQEMKNKFLWVYFLTIGTGAVLSFGISFFITRPIKTLTVATEQIAGGQYGEQLAIKRQDEIGQLAVNFNKMTIAVREKVEELSEGARQKEDFAANFAHELKTPLTSIIGYADRIYQKDLPREEQKQAAWYIWNEGLRLEALSQKLMDLTLLNNHKFLLEEMGTDVLFEELVRDTMYHAARQNVSVKSDMEKAYVKVEYDLFKTLFYNLADNAIKANAKHITIRGRLEQENLFYRIEIADDGNGIPPEEIKRITEAFYMVDKSRSRKLHGAGLGLALSQRIAEIHGTALEFNSDGIQGTTVCFLLRCEEAKDE